MLLEIADGVVRPHTHVFAIIEDKTYWAKTEKYVHEGRLRRTWNGFKVGNKYIGKNLGNVYSRKRAAEITLKLEKVTAVDTDGDYMSTLQSQVYNSLGIPPKYLYQGVPSRSGKTYSMKSLQQAISNMPRGTVKTSPLTRLLMNSTYGINPTSAYLGRDWDGDIITDIRQLYPTSMVCNLADTTIPLFKRAIEARRQEIMQEQMDDIVDDIASQRYSFRVIDKIPECEPKELYVPKNVHFVETDDQYWNAYARISETSSVLEARRELYKNIEEAQKNGNQSDRWLGRNRRASAFC